MHTRLPSSRISNLADFVNMMHRLETLTILLKLACKLLRGAEILVCSFSLVLYMGPLIAMDNIYYFYILYRYKVLEYIIGDIMYHRASLVLDVKAIMALLSIVHEYSVLYTSRIIQKDKRWCDGRLRFYELNNKIEVYSSDMLLVASDFYPHQAHKPVESDVFEDGKLYTFPSGKLMVEFVEYIGSFQRDLTSVLSRKHTPVKKESAHLEMPSSHVQVKMEPIDMSIIRGEDINSTDRPKPRPRSIGLSRYGKRGSIFSAVHKPSAEDDADSLYLKSMKFQGRIPPGSNKLSQRLSSELGLSDRLTGGTFEVKGA